VKACVQGTEGKRLLEQSFAHSSELGIKGSPTLMIGGETYAGTRRVESIEHAVCKEFAGPAPEHCGSLAVPPTVNVTILSDARCRACDTKRLQGTLHERVASPALVVLDYGDPAGRALFEAVRPAKLPAVVFDRSLEADKDAFDTFGGSSRLVGDKYVVSAGDWNPMCMDDGGCKAAECADVLMCQPEVSKKLDLYMMGRCPYAAKAVVALKDVLADFDKKNNSLDLSIHFIGRTEKDGSFWSMHGSDEVADDLRDVCAIQHYPQNRRYLDYMACRAADLKADWKTCTGGKTGIDADVLRKCAEGTEGKTLLTKSFEQTNRVGISASPTWVSKGKYDFSGIERDMIKTRICEHETLAACKP
jgi:hypothetical protein